MSSKHKFPMGSEYYAFTKRGLRDLYICKRAFACDQDHLVSPSQYYDRIGSRHWEVYSGHARSFCITNRSGLVLGISVCRGVSVFPGLEGHMIRFISTMVDPVPSTYWIGFLDDARSSVWSWFFYEDYVTPHARRWFSFVVELVRIPWEHLSEGIPFRSNAFYFFSRKLLQRGNHSFSCSSSLSLVTYSHSL
jgi:hypothetical protein